MRARIASKRARIRGARERTPPKDARIPRTREGMREICAPKPAKLLALEK
jgi:hypothetical protein